MENKITVLQEKDPSIFRTNPVIGMRKENDMLVTIQEDRSHDYEVMRDNRLKEVSREDLIKSLESPSGFLFANLGVSAIIEFSYAGRRFIMIAAQKRDDVGDYALKLISGYLPQEEMFNPVKGMLREITEEVIFRSADGKVIPISYRYNNLLFPFREHFKVISDPFVELIPSSDWIIDDLCSVSISNAYDAGLPKMYIQPSMNSCQLVWNFKAEIQSDHMNEVELNKFIQLSKISLDHTEDVFNSQKGVLEVQYKPSGITLLEIDSNNEFGGIYKLQDGQLIEQDSEEAVLSEAFSPKDRGLCLHDHI